MANDQHTGTPLDQEESINLREVVEKYIRYWKFILISLIVVVILAFFYIQSRAPVYESSAMVIVKDDESGPLSGDDMNVFNDLGLVGSNTNLYNEIEVFKSRKLLSEVVRNLSLFISKKKKGHLWRPEQLYYDDCPVSFEPDVSDSSLYEQSVEFRITPLSAGLFQLEEVIYRDNDDEIIKDREEKEFGVSIETSVGDVVFEKSEYWQEDVKGETLIININSVDATVNRLRKKLIVETINKDASVIQLKISGLVKAKNNDILNALIAQHEKQAIRDKNEITKNTSEFIDERMKLIEKELFHIEEIGETFKINNDLVDVEKDVEVMMEKESTAEKAYTKTYIQLKLAEHIKNYMDNNPGYGNLLPANLGLESEAVNEMTREYNKLVLERNAKLFNSSVQNPVVKKIENQLTSIRNSLQASLTNLIDGLQMELETLGEKENKYSLLLNKIPAFEREYREIMRQQQIKETLYLYLLQKREENEIAMASTVGNVKIVDNAYSSPEPIAPKKKLIMLGACLVGFIIPIGFLYIRDLLDNKVHTIDDLECLNIPIAGNIPLYKGKETEVVKQNGKSVISEAFRMLRSNIDFLLPKKQEKGNVLYVTSTIAGEGKTFVSLNLANSLTLTNHTVVLLGLDMRAPMIAQYLHMDESIGVSDYLNDDKFSIEDIIIKSKDNDYLSYITAGTIPPNPSELLVRPRLVELFEQLKKDFDYIIVDNAPIALVVDTLSIVDYADLVLYVVRANYLDKRALDLPESLVKNNKIKHMAGLLNATDSAFSTYHGYGYYRYGYGQNQDNKVKRMKQWFKFGKS